MLPHDTERLTFRAGTMQDVPWLDELNHAPGVMRFLAHHPPGQEKIRREVTKSLGWDSQCTAAGFWIILTRTERTPVGWIELDPKNISAGDLEMGYRMWPKFWGRGLAPEAGRELLRYAVQCDAVQRVTAVTMFVNTPSRRVMEKLGMTHVRTFHEDFDDPLPGTELGEVEYAITREAWMAINQAG